jgi:glycosyltransferase involved in cell wall biosynthesis
MRVAFYAPMKAPDDPKPSGDRMMARLLIKALETAGHTVQVASKFSSRDGVGDYMRQLRLRDVGVTTATRLIQRAETLRPEMRPAVWFTYHLYHKAPDWIGPGFCQAMGIPYIVAEASHAPKQSGGPWEMGHNAVAEALAQAATVISLNSADTPCILPLLESPNRLLEIKPFLDPIPYAEARGRNDSARRVLARRFNIDADVPWLVAVGMMRRGDKYASYRQLGEALTMLQGVDFRLIIAGDGEARSEVMTAMRPLGGKVIPLGEVAPETVPVLYGASDLCVWPAVNEAYGMSLLEAQASGLPVVSARVGGVPDIVTHGVTGILVEPDNTRSFAEAVFELLSDPARRKSMGIAALSKVAEEHNIGHVANQLDDVLLGLHMLESNTDHQPFGF